MKKTFLSASLFFLSLMFFIPAIANAQPLGGEALVPCNGADCTIQNFFDMIGRVYRFIVWDIATPLAILAMLVGGIILMISAGNPNLASLGKKILTVTIIGLVLVFCALLIVNAILTALGAPTV